MSTFHNPARLQQAAAALIAIDQAGLMGDLPAAIAAARRQHRRETFNQTVGTSLYIDGLASALSRATGLPWRDCRAAVAGAIAPDWGTVAIDAIVGLARGEVGI
ncbi:MAG: hypothetical protein IT427_05800 [Pirellulales bacterium]|nr:hypothetical protein [Pirellulales bacterium]